MSRRVLIVPIFGFVGPPVGGVVLALGSVIRYGETEPLAIALALILAPIAAYLFGLVPALLTGAAGALLAPLLRGWWLWVLVMAGVGALVAAASPPGLGLEFMLLNPRAPPPTLDPGERLLFALAGATAAAASAVAARLLGLAGPRAPGRQAEA